MEHFREGRPLTEAGKKQLTKIKLKEGKCANCKFCEGQRTADDVGIRFFCMNAPNSTWLEVYENDWCLFWEEEGFVKLEHAEAYNETKKQVKEYMEKKLW